MKNKKISIPEDFKWSPSSIKQAMGCYRRFIKKHIEHAPPEVLSPELQEGIKVHQKISQYITSKDESFIQEFPQAVQKSIKNLFSLGEIHSELLLENESLKGYIDIMIENQNQWIIIDAKNRYEFQINNNDFLQLHFYLYLLSTKKQKSSSLIGILALKNSYTPLKLIPPQITSFIALEDFIYKLIEKAKENLKKRQLYVGDCPTCEYILSCNIKEKLLKSPTPENIAKLYIHLNSASMLIKNYLSKEITDQNIITDGYEVGWHIKQKTIVDETTLRLLLDKYEMPYIAAYRPDLFKIKKLAKSIEEFSSAINIEQELYFDYKKTENNEELP